MVVQSKVLTGIWSSVGAARVRRPHSSLSTRLHLPSLELGVGGGNLLEEDSHRNSTKIVSGLLLHREEFQLMNEQLGVRKVSQLERLCGTRLLASSFHVLCSWPPFSDLKSSVAPHLFTPTSPN
ncbi:hypothetical protein J6590_062756 [Homalodisca vitripennis]|nr:hypothetical protein J6590_062756 [Homalodisca vitripennis]